jgi:hypothetical protein
LLPIAFSFIGMGRDAVISNAGYENRSSNNPLLGILGNRMWSSGTNLLVNCRFFRIRCGLKIEIHLQAHPELRRHIEIARQP